MNLDKALNLVVPVERTDGTTIYVHATPVSRAVFDQFFLVIAKTFAAIYTSGLSYTVGPRIAAKMLKKVAEDLGGTEPETREASLALVTNGLISEMRRLSNVIVPSERGWMTLPMHEALARNLLDLDDADEVENAITFFILASAMHKKKEARWVVTEAAKFWAAQTTSLNSTAFAASLPTSTPDASSGAKVIPSLIAS